MSSSLLPSYQNEYVQHSTAAATASATNSTTDSDTTERTILQGDSNENNDKAPSLILLPHVIVSIMKYSYGSIYEWWHAYNKALDTNPLIANALTSFVGFFFGDLLAQLLIVKSPDGLDLKRLMTLSSFGLFYHGPTGHYYYDWLDAKIIGTDGSSVAMKIMIDQIFYCPFFMVMFFTYLGIVAGDTFASIVRTIRSDLFIAVLGSWKVWPLVHIINFKFVSTKHRLIFINGVQIAFNMFLSLLGSKKN